MKQTGPDDTGNPRACSGLDFLAARVMVSPQKPVMLNNGLFCKDINWPGSLAIAGNDNESSPVTGRERIAMPVMTFIEFDGTVREVNARAGMSFLTVAKENGVDLEGACGGSLACATCHLIVPGEWYDRLPPAAAPEQLLLDVAFDMTATSRLGCQIRMTQDLDGCVVRVADKNRNLALSPFAAE